MFWSISTLMHQCSADDFAIVLAADLCTAAVAAAVLLMLMLLPLPQALEPLLLLAL
jgi:hypothetical protein